MSKKKILDMDGAEMVLIQQNEQDYISLTDMARSQMEDLNFSFLNSFNVKVKSYLYEKIQSHA